MRFRVAIIGHFQGPQIKRQESPVGYNWCAILEGNNRPSGSTTTKNCFIGTEGLDCSARSLAMKKSSLATTEPVMVPNQIRCRTLGIATTIAATIRDNRNKNIVYKVVRLTVQIGCRIVCRLTRLPIFVSLDRRRTRQREKDTLRDFTSGEPTGSIEEATSHPLRLSACGLESNGLPKLAEGPRFA